MGRGWWWGGGSGSSQKAPWTPMVTHYAVMNWNLPFSRMHMYRPLMSRIKLGGSTMVRWNQNLRSRCVWRKKYNEYDPKRWWPMVKNTEVETLCFEAVFLLNMQHNFTAMRGQWTGPCTVKSWMRTSFPQTEHWRWAFQHDNDPNATKPTKEWLNKKLIKVM